MFGLQKWVEGYTLHELNPRSPDALLSWGKTCGLLSKHLVNFDHPVAHRFYKWNPSETLHSKKNSEFFNDDEKVLAEYFWKLFEEQALVKLSSLRKSVNHNDAHDQKFTY